MEENKAYVELNPNQLIQFKKTYKINPDETIVIKGGNLYEFVKNLQQENAELKEKIAELQRKYSKQYQINENKGYLKAERTLEEIREMVNEPCVPSEKDCLTCPTSCFTKDILIKINEVLRND